MDVTDVLGAVGVIGRKRRATVSVVMGMSCALIAMGAFPSAAAAQVISGDHDQYKSPQHFALELRFGPYKPDIDSEFSGQKQVHPFQDFFGSGRKLMSQVEFDYQIIRHVGSAGIGLGIGYFSEDGANLTVPAGTVSADTSTLKLIPFSLSAVYRFDLPLERFKFPLVPYGKLGLDYVIWSINNGNGDVPQTAGGIGHGGTWGWHAAVGLSFVLDFLDPAAARQFDAESGVNHTHLFVELGHWNVSGLGAANKLHVGDTTWVGGMLFEF